MKTNHVREKLQVGKPTIGCFLGLGSPSVAELMAHAGVRLAGHRDRAQRARLGRD